MTYSCSRRFRIDTMHRVLGHSKCSAIHGHSWFVEVTVTSTNLDNLGMILDFGKIKDILGSWLDKNWDHTSILHKNDPLIIELDERQKSAVFITKPPYLIDCNPTSENLASHFYKVAEDLLKSYPIKILNVRIYETPNCWSDYS